MLTYIGADQPWQEPQDAPSTESWSQVWWLLPVFLAAFIVLALIVERKQWVLPLIAIGLFVVWPVVSCVSK